MQDSASTSRRHRLIVAPLVLIVLLALAWTGGWFYAARRAEATIAAWIEREAQEGRVYACASRKIEGFPFRIELRCTEPKAELQGRAGPVVLQARELLALAQVYQPDLIIAEVSGPLTASIGADAQYTAEWTLLQASLRGRPSAPERISIVLDDPKLAQRGQPSSMIARAGRFEAHLRRRSNGPTQAEFDFAARTSAAVVEGVKSLAQRPIDAELTAVLHGIRDLRAQPLAERLREWQAAGGRLELTRARAQQGGTIALAKGQVALTPQGKLDGAIELTTTGLEQIAPLLLGQESGARAQAGLLAALNLLGRAELEGKRAISVPIRFKEGAVFLGPVGIGQIPPVF